ncbi:kinase-like domain-containing protein [Trichoderma austrokoningii]
MSELSNDTISFVTAQSHLSAFESHSSQASTIRIEPHAIAAAEALEDRRYTHCTLSSSQPSLGSATQIERRIVAYEAALALKEEREAARLAVKAPTTEELTKLFYGALDKVKAARMIVASTRFPNDSNQNSSIIPLSCKATKRVMFGVTQQAQDVDLVLRLPLEDADTAVSTDIECQVIYDPGRDDCLLINHTEPKLRLTNFGSSSDLRVSIKSKEHYLIQPGMWRISIDDDEEDCGEHHHLAEFLLLGRRFNVSIQRTRRKRGIDDDAEENTGKRRKRNNHLTGDTIIQPINKTIIEPGPATTATKRTKPCDLPPSSVVRTITDKAAVPLVDLADGDTAFVRAPGDKTTKSQSLSGAKGPASYTLQRIEKTGATPSASVFTCKHSTVSGLVVAKVLQYKRDSPDRVRSALSLWKREKTTLEKVKHRNIVSLKAFDGRMLAMYLEHLSPSLNRGDDFKYSQSDIYIILRDISSALGYLKTIPLIHNDIKPSNITYDERRGAVLIDFGMATSTSQPDAGGTSLYLPPDLIDDNTRGAPGDIWALGITALYLLGRIKYPDTSGRGWNMRGFWHKENQLPMREWLRYIFSVRDDLSPAYEGTGKSKLESIVFKMLEPVSEMRFTAEEINSALG